MSLSSKIKNSHDKDKCDIENCDHPNCMNLEKIIESELIDNLCVNDSDSEFTFPDLEASTSEKLDPKHEERFNSVMFICDRSFDGEFKEKIDPFFKNIRCYGQEFINRSCKDLYERGLRYIYIDISNKKAKRWLELNIKKNHKFTRICVYDGNKNNKFLKDLKSVTELIVPMTKIDRLSALGFHELLSQTDDYHRIHDPANPCLAFLSCSKSIESEN